MNDFQIFQQTRKLLIFATTFVAMILMTSRVSWAGLTLESSSGSSFYGIANTISPGPSTPLFNPSNGEMLASGGGLPQLGALTGPVQYSTQSPISPYPGFVSISTTDTSSPTGYVSPSFGNATTNIYTSTAGSTGIFTKQGGIYWGTPTSLGTNLPVGSSEASVSLSTASATYTNTGTSTIEIEPGMQFPVFGNLEPNSYIALGVSGSFSLSFGSDTISTTALNPFTLAAESTGGNIETYAYNNGPPLYNVASVIAYQKSGEISGEGDSLFPAPIDFAVGESITFNASLTLIASGVSGGSFTSQPVLPELDPSTSVPEPSSFALLGAGLALMMFWQRSRGCRFSARFCAPESAP